MIEPSKKVFEPGDFSPEVLMRDLSWSPAGFSPKFSSDGQGEEEAEMILAKVPPMSSACAELA